MDLGCHSLDLAIWISEASEVAVCDQHFVFDNGVDREVEAHLLLQTSRGSCKLDYFVTWLRPTDNVIRLQFDHCAVSLPCQPAKNLEVRGSHNDRHIALLSDNDAKATTVYQAFYLEWMAFLEGVRNRQASEFSARSALTTVRAIEALYNAGKQSA